MSAARQPFRPNRMLLSLCCVGLLAGALLLLPPALDTHVSAAGSAFLVKDLYPGSESGLGRHNMYPWATARGRLFFAADDGVHGEEFWTSDGTAAGTTRVSDTGPSSPAPSYTLQRVGGTVFMLTRESEQSTTLWKSDGTAPGTIRVENFNPGTSAYYIPSGFLADANGALVFELYAPDQPLGYLTGALWRSDGTSAGTTTIKEQLMPETPSVAICGKVFFSAGQHVSGSTVPFINIELWQSDGTSDGTFEVQDIAPGEASSVPRSITDAGQLMFFSADDGTSGRELWALPIKRTSAAGPTPSIPLPHQLFLPHAQGDAIC